MSEQDFFFDEDEKPAEKPAKSTDKPAPAKAAAKPAPKAAAPAAAAPAGGIELTWTVTALIGVVALLLGVIVGYAIPKGASTVSTGLPAGVQQQEAPQLTPEQMSSGELPAGHPNIGGEAGGGSTGATGSAETTGN